MLTSKNKKTKAFLNHVKTQAEELGVRIIISKKNYITLSKNIKCYGYFTSNFGTKSKPTLAISTGKGEEFWLPIFVHETCHMEQWVKNTKLWEESDKLDIIDEWINGKEFSKKIINKSIKNSRELELDCEKRTVKKIKKWNLPINTKTYTQKANTYVFFHNYIKKTRRWTSTKKSTYNSENIYSKMPSKWLKSYSKLPAYVENLFDQELDLI